MNTEKISLEKKVGIIFGIFALIILGGGYFYSFLTHQVAGASYKEFERLRFEKDDNIKVKCLDPKLEFLANETKYLQKYNLLFSPRSKYDILENNTNEANSNQVKDATNLKIEEDLVIQSCLEAKQENNDVKRIDSWDYFKANWRSMTFNGYFNGK
jgi:hypothetical protein